MTFPSFQIYYFLASYDYLIDLNCMNNMNE